MRRIGETASVTNRSVEENHWVCCDGGLGKRSHDLSVLTEQVPLALFSGFGAKLTCPTSNFCSQTH